MSDAPGKPSDVAVAHQGAADRAEILSRFASRKLNLGCGFDAKAGYINVDLNDFHRPDLVADIANMVMLPSQSFEEIFAQDVLEHFHWRDTPNVLYEWNRVLKMGGRVFIRTLYLNGLLRRFESPDFRTIEGQKLLIINLFSMQKYVGDYHLCGFTERLLRFYVWASGFEIEKLEVRDQWLFEFWMKKTTDYSFDHLVTSDSGNAEFVEACYRNILGRSADPSGLEDLKRQLDEKAITRDRAIRVLLTSEEKQNALIASAPSFEMQFHERGQ